ncbi:hypothetical protein HHK36_002815 [Tetracentron sinense]|uniref:Uncharacterized protein n=1 Tax=Tetracentron sinense TaxID=13715 RepID=A0A834ZMP8_TETSI|nr:hypothetical protein HHK36_002815 [Tetracentron sinense]
MPMACKAHAERARRKRSVEEKQPSSFPSLPGPKSSRRFEVNIASVTNGFGTQRTSTPLDERTIEDELLIKVSGSAYSGGKSMINGSEEQQEPSIVDSFSLLPLLARPLSPVVQVTRTVAVPVQEEQQGATIAADIVAPTQTVVAPTVAAPVSLRRSSRDRRSAMSSDYEVYLNEGISYRFPIVLYAYLRNKLPKHLSLLSILPPPMPSENALCRQTPIVGFLCALLHIVTVMDNHGYANGSEMIQMDDHEYDSDDEIITVMVTAFIDLDEDMHLDIIDFLTTDTKKAQTSLDFTTSSSCIKLGFQDSNYK